MATNEIEKHIDTLVILARAKWGVIHMLKTLDDHEDHFKCIKCGMEYVAYPYDSAMKKECELWKEKILGMIGKYEKQTT